MKRLISLALAIALGVALGTSIEHAYSTVTTTAAANPINNIVGGSINNTPIGATTPSTGSFTTLGVSGLITKTNTTADTLWLQSSSTGTGANYFRLVSTGGTYEQGIENSTATLYGATAYDYFTAVPTGKGYSIFVGGTGVVGRFTSTGLNSAAIGATTPSTGAFTTVFAGDTISQSKASATMYNGYNALNATSGVAAGVYNQATAGTNSFYTYVFSQGYTTASQYVQNGTLLETAGVGGIHISAHSATGPVKIWNNDAQTASFTTTGLAITGNVTTTTAGSLQGTATNDSAAAGKIGELLTTTVASGSAVSLVTATAKTVMSVSLTAGDWDCNGQVVHNAAATTSITILQVGISAADNTLPTQAGGSGIGTDPLSIWRQAAAVPGGALTTAVGPVRVSLAGTTTIYLVASDTFSVSTMTAYGTIRCRRVR